MIRFLRSVVLAIFFMVLGAAIWHWRDLWLPRAREVISASLPDEGPAGWDRVSLQGAQRSLQRMQLLDSPTGPAYVNIAPADFAAYVLGAALTQLREVDATPDALVDDDKLWLRTRIRLVDLGGRDALGPLASMFEETERLVIAGRLEGVRAGLAQYRLTDVAVRDLRVPQAAVSRLVTRWGPPRRPEGIADDALPIELPPYVADLRLSRGRVTLYKAAR